MRLVAGLTLALVMVAIGEGYVAWRTGLMLPMALPLALIAAAAAAFAILAIDTARRRLRGPTRAQIAEVLDLLRERGASDAATAEQLAAVTAATRLLAAEPELRTLEAALAHNGAAIETFDRIADVYPTWRADLAQWYAIARRAAPSLALVDIPADAQAEHRARTKIPFNKNLSSADLKSALSYLMLRERFDADVAALAGYRNTMFDSSVQHRDSALPN